MRSHVIDIEHRMPSAQQRKPYQSSQVGSLLEASCSMPVRDISQRLR